MRENRQEGFKGMPLINLKDPHEWLRVWRIPASVDVRPMGLRSGASSVRTWGFDWGLERAVFLDCRPSKPGAQGANHGFPVAHHLALGKQSCA